MALIPFEERKAIWVREVTSPEFDFPRASVVLPYVIVGSARSGTTMLCSSLAETRKTGHPMEYFHTKFLPAFANTNGELAIDKYFNEIMRRRTSPNGRFGAKILAHQFNFVFRGRQDAGINFLRAFKRFIYVYRRDKVDQAISWMLALEHRVWNTEKPDERPPERGFQPGDVEAVNTGLKRIASEETLWQCMARGVPMSPLIEVCYEDLQEDPAREVARVLAHLEVKIPIEEIPMPKTVKLAREGTKEIKREYLRAMGKSAAA